MIGLAVMGALMGKMFEHERGKMSTFWFAAAIRTAHENATSDNWATGVIFTIERDDFLENWKIDDGVCVRVGSKHDIVERYRAKFPKEYGGLLDAMMNCST